MSVTKTTTKIGIEDANIAAAGGTFSRTRVVNGSTTTGTVSYFNAGSFPFTTANQSTITGAGWAATNPSAFAAELGPVLAASVANATALQAITWTPTANQLILVGDQRRPFVWDAASTAADDGVLIIKVTAITTGRFRAVTAGSADTATSVASTAIPAPFAEFEAIGDLAAMVALDVGSCIIARAVTIERISLVCPSSAAAGTITVDLLKEDTVGAGLTSLYSAVAKPTLTCNAGAVWATTSGASLPDTVILPANCRLVARIDGAPAGCTDLKVQVY